MRTLKISPPEGQILQQLMFPDKIDPVDIIYSNRYKVIKKLNEGAFGRIYKAYDLQDESRNPIYAIKVEDIGDANSPLIYECKVYQ